MERSLDSLLVTLGSLLSLAMFFTIFLSVFVFHGILNQHFFLFAVVLGIYLAIFVLLPRVWPASPAHELAEGARLTAQWINNFLVGVLLVITYIFGVGLAALFIRLGGFSKLRFNQNGKSNWQASSKPSTLTDYEEMF